MLFKTIFLNAIWLSGAFGVAIFAGMQTTQDPETKSASQPEVSDQTLQQVERKAPEVFLWNGSAIHQGHAIHQDMSLACKSCHRVNAAHSPKSSPHLLDLSKARTGEVDSAFLGIHASSVPPALRKHLKLEKEVGAMVDSIVDESPAYHCGLETFDIIVAIDEQPITGEQELLKLVRSKNPGTKLLIEFIRAGQRDSCNVVLGKSRTAQMLQSFRIEGCPATLNSTTNCRECHSSHQE